MITLKDAMIILEYILENTKDLTPQEMNLLDELVQMVKVRYYEENRNGNNRDYIIK